MYLFFEKGTRGVISTITTRYGEANNPYIGDKYDPEKLMKYITYQDANILYQTHCQLVDLSGWKKKI